MLNCLIIIVLLNDKLVKLDVLEEDIKFLERLVDVGVLKFDTVKFECELNKTYVNVNWLKDGKPIIMDYVDKYDGVRKEQNII
jgi:hypothetical protein